MIGILAPVLTGFVRKVIDEGAFVWADASSISLRVQVPFTCPLDRKGRQSRNRRGVDIRLPNVTAATVPKPGVTSSRPAFEETEGKGKKRREERKKQREEDRGSGPRVLRRDKEKVKEREKGGREKERHTQRERPEIGTWVTSLPPTSLQQPCQSRG